MKKNEKIFLNERNQILDIYRQTTFHQFDSSVIHKQIIPYASYSPWENDHEFNKTFILSKKNTLVDIYRCYELWKLAKDINHLDGDILEVGVWRGGTGAILCKACEQNNKTKVYLADTFTGVVKATEDDTVYRGGEHSDTSESIAIELLRKLNLSNFEILKGVFPDDFKDSANIKELKFCHIDVDTYLSAKEVFEYAWPKLVIGGVIIFDDYGFWTCEGVTKYFNSLELKGGLKVYNLNGHGIIIKTNH